jgi:hypothetical protein
VSPREDPADVGSISIEILVGRDRRTDTWWYEVAALRLAGAGYGTIADARDAVTALLLATLGSGVIVWAPPQSGRPEPAA